MIFLATTKNICNLAHKICKGFARMAKNDHMDDRTYKIVYCTPALYSAGGTERVVSAKANYFVENLGYDVTIVVTEGNGSNSFFPLSKKVKVVNLSLNFEELWNVPLSRMVFLYLQKQKKYKRLLKKELFRIKPDITISTLRREINFINDIKDGSLKIGELHLSRSNYRRTEMQRSNIVRRLFSIWWQKDIISQFEKLDKFVVLSTNAVSEWPELTNVTMIPDPLPFKSTVFSSLTNKRVITVGRYSYEKGYDLLLRAWAFVEKQCKDWQLDIYAMGDPTPYVKMIDELSIDQRRCHLNSSLVDVVSEYLQCSILALPSRTEGFGLVIVEAMACGLPVVAFDCENGPRSIISDGEDGCLVPAFDVAQFANSLIALIQDEELRKQMGEKGRRKAECYHIDKVALQWTGLFDDLIQKG